MPKRSLAVLTTLIGFASISALAGSPKIAVELTGMAAGAPQGYSVVLALSVTKVSGSELLADLRRMGLQQDAASGRLVSGLLPLWAIPRLEGLKSLHSIRPSHALFHATSQGALVSVGDTELHAQEARTTYQVDGTGVKVGILSNTFACGEAANQDALRRPLTAANAIETGDLPPGGVENLKDLPEGSFAIGHTYLTSAGIADCAHTDTRAAEGRAIAEVIHDLAPGASLAFHTASLGMASYAQGIRALAKAGATVIVDDTIYLEEPVFQPGGVIAEAVKEVVGQGVTYIAAAGNFGQKTHEAPFRPSGITRTIAGRTVEPHDFDSGSGVDTCQQVQVGDLGNVALFGLHWDQPYASIGNSPGATSDLDLFLMDSTCTDVLTTTYGRNDLQATRFNGGPSIAAASNIGGDPVEVVSYHLPPGLSARHLTVALGLLIGKTAGPAPGRLRVTYASQNVPGNATERNIIGIERGFDIFGENLPEGPRNYAEIGATTLGHANLAEVITVGAVRGRWRPDHSRNFAPDPNAGLLTSPGDFVLETFSARGGTSWIFNEHGRIFSAADTRLKPDLVAVNRVDNLSFGYSNSGPNLHSDREIRTFVGTSAAAAHIAGIAALMKQAVPAAAGAEISAALKATAQDLESAGFDFETGAGLPNAERAIFALKNPGVPFPWAAAGGGGISASGNSDVCASPNALLQPGQAVFLGTRNADVLAATAALRANGKKGDDRLCGSAERDFLSGGAGNDVLEGRGGDDLLKGGTGSDTYVFLGAGIGQDEIRGFDKRDSIALYNWDLNANGQADDFELIQEKNGTRLRFASGDSFLIKSIKLRRIISNVQNGIVIIRQR